MTSRENRPRTGWVKMTPAEIKAFSDEARQAIKKKVDQSIARYMEPQTIIPRRGKPSFGQVYELYTKWRGYSLILVAKRRGGLLVDRDVEDFETQSGRLTLIGVDTFDVAYYRHTDKWWTLQYDCTLKAALTYFRKPSPIWPW
jgi:hypothetical protein